MYLAQLWFSWTWDLASYLGAIRRVNGHPDNVKTEIVFADVKVVQSSRSLEWLCLFD